MKKNTHNQKILVLQNSKGFALLFTVLVITLILTITVGISSTTFKQGILSGLARDSQTAFYQADKLLECALLYHTKTPGGMYDNVTFRCGDVMYTSNASTSTRYYTNNQGGSLTPCGVLRVIPKSETALDNTASLQVSGYNICQANPRQVERTLQVTF